MVEIWKASRANSSTIEVHASGFKDDDATESSGSDGSNYTSSDYSYSDEDEEDDKLDTDLITTSSQINGNIFFYYTLLNPNGLFILFIDKNSNSTLSDRQASLASLPLPKHLSSADEAARRRAVSEAGPRPNMQEYVKKSTELRTANANENSTTILDASAVTNNANNAIEKKDTQIREKTECDCGKNEQHFPTVVMDNKYDTTVEAMYNLLFNSTFMNKFLCEVEKSTGKYNLQV